MVAGEDKQSSSGLEFKLHPVSDHSPSVNGRTCYAQAPAVYRLMGAQHTSSS